MAPDDFPAGGYLRDYVGFWAVWLVLVVVTAAFYGMTRGRAGRARSVVGNLLLFVSAAWTCVVVGETYLRYVYDASDQWGVTLTNFSWARRHFKPNSKNFRDREFTSTRRPDVVRVGCVGGSFTMGWGVNDPADAWPQRLGAMLDAKAPHRFETLNLGRAGTNTGEEAALLELMAPRAVFERVVLAYDLSDGNDLLPVERQFLAKSLPRPTWIDPTRSFVVDYLWFHLRLRDDPYVRDADARQADAYEDPNVWAAQCARFRDISESCRRSAVPLDVVVCPFLADWGDGYRFDACHDRVVEAWTRLGVRVTDLRDAYRGIARDALVVGRNDGHPNERAHEIAARTILERLFGFK